MDSNVAPDFSSAAIESAVHSAMGAAPSASQEGQGSPNNSMPSSGNDFSSAAIEQAVNQAYASPKKSSNLPPDTINGQPINVTPQDQPDAVERTREWARQSGIDPAHPGLSGAVRMLGEYVKQKAIGAGEAVSSDFGTMGAAMRGQATPEQTTAAFQRSFSVPALGLEREAGVVAAREAPNLVESFGQKSAGAGEASMAEQAKAAGASQPIIDAVKAAEKDGITPEGITAAKRHIEADTLPVPVQLTAGQATGDPALISIEKNSRAANPALSERFNEQNGKLVENLDAIKENAAPDVFDTDNVESGKALIDTYNQFDDVLKRDIRNKYQALADANGGTIPLDPSSFLQQAQSDLSRQYKAPFLPSGVQKIMEDIGSNNQPMTFEQYENLRTTLSAAGRTAARQGDGNAAQAISIVRNALEDMPMPEGGEPLKDLADQARSAARNRFQMLEQDPAYKAAVNGTVAPDDFVKKFVVNGKVDHVSQMVQNLQHDPIALQTLKSATINALKKNAGIVRDEGAFRQAGYNKALDALSPKLNIIFDPKTASNLEKLGNVARYTQEQPPGSFVNNSNTFTALMGELGKGTAEKALNTAGLGVLPIGTWARNFLEEKSAQKAVSKLLSPGAGINK